MRKTLLAITSYAALGVAMAVSGAGPAGAIQVQGQGVSPAADLIQVQDNRGRGGGGAGPSDRGGAGVNVRGGGDRGPSVQGNRAPSVRGNFQTRAQTQQRSIRRDVQRRDFDRRVYTRRDNRDWQRFDGRSPRLVHRGWSRDHRHRFFGAFLLGVPFGYTAVVSNPCYDWTYGPYGLGYYWNYDRCPV